MLLTRSPLNRLNSLSARSAPETVAGTPPQRKTTAGSRWRGAAGRMRRAGSSPAPQRAAPERGVRLGRSACRRAGRGRLGAGEPGGQAPLVMRDGGAVGAYRRRECRTARGSVGVGDSAEARGRDGRVKRMARWWPFECGPSPTGSEPAALSSAPKELRGDGGLAFVRFALSAWASGHRLHTEELPCGLRRESPRLSLALHPVPTFPRMVGSSHALRLQGHVTSARQFVALAPGLELEAQASVSGARRVAIALLAYHRIRALWHASGSRRVSNARHTWMHVGPPVFSELALAVRDSPSASAPHRHALRSGRARSVVQRDPVVRAYSRFAARSEPRPLTLLLIQRHTRAIVRSGVLLTDAFRPCSLGCGVQVRKQKPPRH